MGVSVDKDYGVRREKTQDQVLRNSDIFFSGRGGWIYSGNEMEQLVWRETCVMCYLEPREECFKKEGEINSVKCYYTESNGMRMNVSLVFVDMQAIGGSRDHFCDVLFGSRDKVEVVWRNGEEEIDIIYWDHPVTLVRSRKQNVQFRNGSCGQLFVVLGTLDTPSTWKAQIPCHLRKWVDSLVHNKSHMYYPMNVLSGTGSLK